jgi:hypothetical protein
MSSGMRSAIVSIAVMVSSMSSSFRAGIAENVEPHHSPLCFGPRERPGSQHTICSAHPFREFFTACILVKRWQPLWRRDENPECQNTRFDPETDSPSIELCLKRVKLPSL